MIFRMHSYIFRLVIKSSYFCASHVFQWSLFGQQPPSLCIGGPQICTTQHMIFYVFSSSIPWKPFCPRSKRLHWWPKVGPLKVQGHGLSIANTCFVFFSCKISITIRYQGLTVSELSPLYQGSILKMDWIDCLVLVFPLLYSIKSEILTIYKGAGGFKLL